MVYLPEHFLFAKKEIIYIVYIETKIITLKKNKYMKNSCKEITFNQLKKGQFIVIGYQDRNRDFFIGKVVTSRTDKTIEIDKIGECISNVPHFDEIDRCFRLHDYTLRKTITKKENELILIPSGSGKILVTRIIVIDKEPLKKIAQEMVTEKEEERKQAEKRENDFKTAMETVGLLKNPIEEEKNENCRTSQFTGEKIKD